MDKLLGFPVVELDLRPRLYGEWTTTPPTQEGWYWVNVDHAKHYSPDPDPIVVRVRRDEYDEADLRVAWQDYSVDLSGFTHWLGPLPIPEPPLSK